MNNTLFITIKKTIAILIIAALLITNTGARAFALEAPSAPTAPSTPDAPSAPNSPDAPKAPDAPSANSDTKSSDDSKTDETKNEDTTKKDRNRDENKQNNDSVTPTPTQTQTQNSTQQATPTPTPTTGTVANKQQGDTAIETGDATTTGTAVTDVNNNLATTPTNGTSQGAAVVNSGNGVASDNSGSIQLDNTDTTIQNNGATVNSDMQLATNTGSNYALKNNGDSSINTGDANTTGTVITSANTNIDGVMVSEFNIVDDHTGDIVLDFGANCISGCAGNPASAVNMGNGAYSNNASIIDETTNSSTFQNNNALVGNDLILSANSGENMADKNTGGDSSITTGDANVAANALTFVNNNLSGNVVFGVVNIFGDLIGDLIFPEEQFDSLGTTAYNGGNGAYSDNTATTNIDNSDQTFQTNNADIANNIIFDANTGNNFANKNTGGSSTIQTGDSNVDANVLNIVNSNLANGNWWLVVVNEAGNWVGKIMGAPEGTNFAGSTGTDFQVDENGYITAVNKNNGAGSDNTSSVNQTNNTTTVQENNAQIENNLHLSANTGDNSTSYNTGGNSDITTGDANIVANLVNFVNNNITGNGKLVVTMVNVFGSWMGDFVTPGQKQEEKNKTANSQKSTTQNSNTQHVGGQKTEEEKTTSELSNEQQNTPAATNPKTNSTVLAAKTETNPTVNTTSKTSNDSDTGNSVLVKSSSQDAGSFTNGVSKNVVSINLAWMFLLIPFIGIAFLGKRYIVPKLLSK